MGLAELTASFSVTTYSVRVFQRGRSSDLGELKQAVAKELSDLGLHRTVNITVAEALPDSDAPTVGIWLGSPEALDDLTLHAAAEELLQAGGVIIPVVSDLNQFSKLVPPSLTITNGAEWSSGRGLPELVHTVFEELGIEERQRRVFISHPRDDGLGAAEQVHDRLAHHRFLPFIDRFAIPKGVDMQAAIADALEDYAFVLLLETPNAHASTWVYDELEYALSHGMGVLVLSWPNVETPVPGSQGIPRVLLTQEDIETDAHGYEVLSESALDRLAAQVEAAHASALARRRRYLVASVLDSARAAGATSWTPLREWRVLVEIGSKTTVVGTTPRLPTAHDLQDLAEAAASMTTADESILVHSARALGGPLRRHLQWVAGDRNLTVLPENAIGGLW